MLAFDKTFQGIYKGLLCIRTVYEKPLYILLHVVVLLFWSSPVSPGVCLDIPFNPVHHLYIPRVLNGITPCSRKSSACRDPSHAFGDTILKPYNSTENPSEPPLHAYTVLIPRPQDDICKFASRMRLSAPVGFPQTPAGFPAAPLPAGFVLPWPTLQVRAWVTVTVRENKVILGSVCSYYTSITGWGGSS